MHCDVDPGDHACLSEQPAGKVGVTTLGYIFHQLGDDPSFKLSSYTTIISCLRIASWQLLRDVFRLLCRDSKARADADTA